jgi:hypothetical protein
VAARAKFRGEECAQGHYTRTTSHAGWIVGGARFAAKAGAYSPPEWAR